jgi:hypothetical protein
MARHRATTRDRAASSTPKPEKPCAACGRTITWRAKWARDWDAVRYCSDRCRRAGVTDTDLALEHAIRTLLSTRPASASICPSEAARRVAQQFHTRADAESDAARAAVRPTSPAAEPEAWRTLMEPARAAARRLVALGEVVITQGGRVVDPSTASGPIRIRRA